MDNFLAYFAIAFLFLWGVSQIIVGVLEIL